MTIDGSIGEGGGQVLRTSLSLAAIAGTEIAIEKIRAKRDKPGLKRQHLTCVKAVAEICGAKVSEVTVGSNELEFAPGKIKYGNYRFDVGTAGGVIRLKIKPFSAANMVRDYALDELGEYKGGKVVGVVSSIPRDIAEAEVGIVAKKFRSIGIKSEIREVSSLGPGNYCYVKLDYERATVVFSGIGTYNKSRKAVANDVVQQTNEFLKSGKACEKHLADQLLVPAAILLECRRWYFDEFEDWKVDVQKETEHFKTNQMVIDQFLSE